MGGGHKQLYRIIDFKRDILDIPATVEAIEYDPNRTAHIALLHYTNGEKRYILAPEGLKAGDKIVASNAATTNDFTVGNSFPLVHHPALDPRPLRRDGPGQGRPDGPLGRGEHRARRPSRTATPSSRCPRARSAW